ncbi:MAG: YraN family protein [Ardenticatenaceae bacterium]
MASSGPVARGNRGERWAAEALRAAGYQILARRWRIPGGEIDIIARDRDGFAFVEVKSRKGAAFGAPETAVTHRKLALLHRAAEQWLLQRIGDRPTSWRIDIVAIELDHHDRPHRITIHQYFEV